MDHKKEKEKENEKKNEKEKEREMKRKKHLIQWMRQLTWSSWTTIWGRSFS